MQLTIFPVFEQIIEDFPDAQAFLWDMDGTLINTEVHHTQSLQMLLEEVHDEPLTEEYEHFFIGKTDEVVFSFFQNEGFFPEFTLEKLILKKNQILLNLFHSESLKSLMVPQIVEFLETAKKHGKKLALVTSSEKIIAHHILNELNLFNSFDLVLCREDTPQHKPHPDPYLLALEKLDHSHKHCVCFEDSITGQHAAKAANIPFVKAMWF